MIKAPQFWWKPLSFWGKCFSWVGWVYGQVVSLRLYFIKPTKVSVPVICVGNLSLGGTGKTPVVLFLANHFLSKKKKVGILTRGYGGCLIGPVKVMKSQHTAQEVGDEPLLLAAVAPTWVSRDRVAGARAMMKEGIELILLDDGYQNPFLYKDINIVVVDGLQGFGNKEVFPCGPLRESLNRGLKRADAVVVVRPPSQTLKQDLKFYKKDLLEADIEIDTKAIPRKKVVAFCGIGNPSKFFASLDKEEACVAAKKSFPDHHAYSSSDLKDLKKMAHQHKAVLVTTEKDWVRLDKKDQKDILAVPLILKWKDWAIMEKVLKRKISKS